MTNIINIATIGTLLIPNSIKIYNMYSTNPYYKRRVSSISWLLNILIFSILLLMYKYNIIFQEKNSITKFLETYQDIIVEIITGILINILINICCILYYNNQIITNLNTYITKIQNVEFQGFDNSDTYMIPSPIMFDNDQQKYIVDKNMLNYNLSILYILKIKLKDNTIVYYKCKNQIEELLLFLYHSISIVNKLEISEYQLYNIITNNEISSIYANYHTKTSYETMFMPDAGINIPVPINRIYEIQNIIVVHNQYKFIYAQLNKDILNKEWLLNSGIKIIYNVSIDELQNILYHNPNVRIYYEQEKVEYSWEVFDYYVPNKYDNKNNLIARGYNVYKTFYNTYYSPHYTVVAQIDNQYYVCFAQNQHNTNMLSYLNKFTRLSKNPLNNIL